ncbi:MAG: hypothetical protein AAGH60_02150 [Pseudomonadota bacterium]
MDLNTILANATDQEKGRDFELLHPASGEPAGITLRIAGPDSEAQRRAALAMSDELAEMADIEGRVKAEHREAARLNSLARCVLSWNVEVDGQALPFSHENVLRFLKSAAWVADQVDQFAADRSPYRFGGA